ncbi:MAG: anti-sigma factor domain-containing protein [Thermoclostridium sp.]|nr:anti-sigma factor domain-containing protein [Thermoclostridium sp.]
MQTKATIIKLSLLSAIVMTEGCEFKRILRKPQMEVGTEIDIDIKTQPVNKPMFISKIRPSVVFGTLAAALALFLMIFVGSKLVTGLFSIAPQVFAYIDVDINPSVSFSIDKNAKVLGVESLNDDATKLLDGMDFKGKDITDAIILFTEKAKSMEFDSSFVLVSGAVDKLNKDSDVNEEMLEDVLLSIVNNEKMKDFEILSQAVKVSPEMKAAAKENGITLARQAAFIHANKNGEDISLEEIKESETSYIYTILDSRESTEDSSTGVTKVVMADVISPAPEATPEPTAVPTASPTPEPTATPTPTPTPEPTPTSEPTPSPKPTPKPTAVPNPRKATVSASKTESGIKLTWNKTSSSNFVYYKVVISKYNDSPVYPHDGYITYISDVNTTSYIVQPNAGYNGGDFGGKVRPGEEYYFSITACYKDENIRGNAVRKTMPGQAETSSTVRKATVKATAAESGIQLSWNRTDGSNFVYYKVVISKYNDSPIYPNDGYITYISDVNTTSYFVQPNAGYNGGDFGGKVRPGEEYYFSITACYNDENVRGNAVRKTMPGQAETSNTVRKATVKATATESGIQLSWNRTDSSNFVYYKVVISKYNDSPSYPNDGYMTYFSDVNTTSYFVPSNAGYNGGDFGGKVRPGEEYYFSITACYNDENVRGNAVKQTMPGQVETSSTVRKATVKATATESGIQLSWNRTDGSNFVYYKVVMSKYNDSPIYPNDGYITYISDVNTTSYFVQPNAGYNGGDFGGKVRPGEEYYFSITACYNDENVRGNAVKQTMPGEAVTSPETSETLELSSGVLDGKLVLSWNPLSQDCFNYYKVVLSKYNSSPSYPDDGYLYAIGDASHTVEAIDLGDWYNNGDFGGQLVSGEKYYIRITAVYNDKKINSNVLYIALP